jgi:hypothetical protein
MSKESYLRVEEHFNLPQATLHGLTNDSGLCSRFLDYDEKIAGKLSRIGNRTPVPWFSGLIPRIHRNNHQSVSKVPDRELWPVYVS